MSQEHDGVLSGGCHHVQSACYHIAVVQLVLGECVQTGLDGGGIVQNVIQTTAFEGSWRHVDSSKVMGV